MGSTVTIYLDLVKGGVAPNSAAKPKRRAAAHHHQRLASNVANDEDDSGRVPESPTLTPPRRRRRARDAANANRRRTRGNVQSSFEDDSVTDGRTLEETRLREELEFLREETRLASRARAGRRMLSPPPRSDARRDPRRIARATLRRSVWSASWRSRKRC